MKFSQLPFLAATAALAFGATTAQAVDVTGGSAGLSYSTITEDSDFNRLGVEGSLELGFNRNLGLQIDTAYHNFDISGIDSTLVGLHGIYHMHETTSFGAFYSREESEGYDADTFGVELGHEVQDWEFEGYLAHVDTDIGDGTLGGFKARYEISEGFGVTGSFDRGESDAGEASRFAVRLDRDVSPSTNLFLELGTADVEVDTLRVDEPFVGLGGKIAFGAARGTTFDQRGLARLIPGL